MNEINCRYITQTDNCLPKSLKCDFYLLFALYCENEKFKSLRRKTRLNNVEVHSAQLVRQNSLHKAHIASSSWPVPMLKLGIKNVSVRTDFFEQNFR